MRITESVSFLCKGKVEAFLASLNHLFGYVKIPWVHSFLVFEQFEQIVVVRQQSRLLKDWLLLRVQLVQKQRFVLKHRFGWNKWSVTLSLQLINSFLELLVLSRQFGYFFVQLLILRSFLLIVKFLLSVEFLFQILF